MRELLEKQYGIFPGLKGLITYCEKNNFNTIPKCKLKTCNQYVTYNKAYPSRGFASYCSSTCSRKNKTIPDIVESKLNNKDWLYHQRIQLNKSKEQIAKELNISITPVYKYLKKYNIEIPKERILSNTTNAELRLLYENGMSMIGISKKVGMSNVTIKNRLISIGTSLRSHSDNQVLHSTTKGTSRPKILIDRSLMIDMYANQKHPIKSIARTFNCHPETIRRILIQEGVEKTNRRSYIEQTILNMLIRNNIKYTTNRKNIIYPLELDIVLDDFNIAIEINGTYTHSVYSGNKSKTYHFNKYEQCRSRGIRLLQFWENDIINTPDIIEQMILVRCNLNTGIKIHARKCKVGKVSYTQIADMCDKNHIQGAPGKATQAMGLFFEGTLVACIGYVQHTSQKTIITRYCTNSCYMIRGGFGKLLKQIPGEKIITYSHNDISDGELYSKTGFVNIKEHHYDMWYTDYKRIFNRQKFMKCKLHKILENFDEKYTEEQNMVRNGYDVIYKSGTKTWVLERLS